MPTLTVFTPAYNRAHTLPRTYESLRAQTSKDFLWLIVDDGSKDDTAELVRAWQAADNGFEIRYIYKENGGMHTAHNTAYENIDTELNVCIDSDDLMSETAVEDIVSFWRQNGSENVAGIVALDSNLEGKIIGTELPANVKPASTRALYDTYNVSGDKKFIYRTDIIRSVPPYPEFPGEKLVPLSYKYDLVADKYEMLLLNRTVCLVDYQPDGSSGTIFRQYLQSPRGFAFMKAFSMSRAKSAKELIKCTLHYIAECRIAKSKTCIKNSPKKLITVLLYPFGMLTEQYIYFVNRRNKK